MAALLMNIQFYMSIWFHSLGMTAGFVFDHIMFPIWATIFFMDLFLSGGVMVKDIQSLIQGNADDFSYTLGEVIGDILKDIFIEWLFKFVPDA